MPVILSGIVELVGATTTARFLYAMQKQLILDILSPSVPTLDGFVGSDNAPAVHALRHQSAPGRAIYLWGTPGSGRTHLLRAVSQNTHAIYLNPQTGQGPSLRELVEHEQPPHRLIAIDNVDGLDAAGQADLFTLYNQWRQQAGTPHAFALITAGNQAPRALSLREDVRTRLAWDLVFRLHLLTDNERAYALQSRAESLGLVLAPGLIPWLLVHHTRDMGQLTALIDALDHYSLERQRAITLPLLKDLLKHNPTEPSF